MHVSSDLKTTRLGVSDVGKAIFSFGAWLCSEVPHVAKALVYPSNLAPQATKERRQRARLSYQFGGFLFKTPF